MANSQLEVILKEQDVAKDNAAQLLKAFGAPFEEAGDILANYSEIVVTEEDQFSLMAEARSKRLKLKEIRVSVEKKRKELKEDSLRTGKAIDSVAKFVKDTIEPAEEYLEQQEKFAEIRQAERKAKAHAERIEKLSQYVEDVSLYALEDMTDEAFTTLLSGAKQTFEEKKATEAKIEADRIAKEKADEKARIEQAKENERLRAEAIERDKREAEKAAEFQAEQARIQKEADDKIAAERAEREKLEQEKREREAAEAKQKAEAEESERQALLAPDKDKLLGFATMIEELTLPALSNKDAQAVLDNVEELLAKVTTYIRGNVKGL